MVERGGKAKTYHVPVMNRHNVIGKIKDDISITADAVYSDDSRLYDRMPANIQKYEIVNHSAKEWVRGDVHTGTIDGYWGLLKRGVIGTYLSEFQFKWNHRKARDIFVLVIAALVIGSRLKYDDLISADDAPAQDKGPAVELDGAAF
jgi:hypothetical protein